MGRNTATLPAYEVTNRQRTYWKDVKKEEGEFTNLRALFPVDPAVDGNC